MVLAAMAMVGMAAQAQTMKERGFEVLEQIRREYYLPQSKLYCEEIDRNGKKSGPCFNWSTGVLLSALNAAATLDPKYKTWLREYADASRVYWNKTGPVPGYDVLPTPKPVDRYYDDNAWMVIALVETHEILGDKKYLDWAEESLKYVLSGWDDKLGGGIYWRESDKAGKNTCSNAPSAVAAFEVFKYRRESEYLNKAYAMLEWVKKLQDPADGLFWDNMNMNGRIDKTKWTYNTGLYLRAKASLRPLRCSLGDQALIDQGRKLLAPVVKSSLAHWFDPTTGAAKDEGKFAHLLFEGLTYASDGKESDAAILKALDYLYKEGRSPKGRYGNRWDKPANPDAKEYKLIDQASAARGFLFAARFTDRNPK